MRVLIPRQEGHEYDVDHRAGVFYLRTNRDAKNFKVVTAPVEDPSPARWKELIPHRPEVNVADFDLFRDHAVVTEREGGLPHLRVLDLAKGHSHRIALPEPAYSVMLDRNPEFGTSTIRLRYQSMVTPPSVYDYDMTSRGLTLDKKHVFELGFGKGLTHREEFEVKFDPGRNDLILRKRTEVLGGFDPSEYATEWTHATASDGTAIPISLVRRKDVPLDGSAPLLLYGYGSYGSPMAITFAADRLSLLDLGVIYAQAHIRGGGDLGEPWHDAGKMMQKKNTFTDFIAVADHLVASKYTSPGRMAIRGGSDGGLLIGAVVNLRPDLARAAVLDVPFVDVVNTMLDASLPLTVQEYLEWGNPNFKAEYDYIKTYCPYTNLARGEYPSILVRTSLNDSQVMYWEPAKYVARLRALKTDSNPLLFKINMAGGHGGSSGSIRRHSRSRRSSTPSPARSARRGSIATSRPGPFSRGRRILPW